MSQEIIKTISPSTNQVVIERTGVNIEDARRVVAQSQDAFAKWRKTPLTERKSIISKALAIVLARKDELGLELTVQMGRPIAYSVKEIETMQKRADYLLKIADEALADIPGQREECFRRWIKKDAVGPTLVVFAWNVRDCEIQGKHYSLILLQFPFLIIVNALIPALLAGNSVILKPSPQTPLVGERFVEIFNEAGLPPNVLQNIHSGSPNVLKDIVRIPGIQLITFTGSTKVGWELREAVASRTVPLNLELGGNDPAYVRPDADLKYVAAQLVDGAVFNAGQSCCAVERIYVHTDVHDAFVKEVQKELKK